MQASMPLAAVVGAVTALDLLLFRLWMAAQGPQAPAAAAACWVLAIAALIVAPAWLLVIGPRQRTLDRLWFKDPAQVARVMAVANRLTVWFLAFVAGTVLLQFMRS